jgi:hypothetical protein
MASLWNKLTSSNKANLPSSPAEASPKSTRKQSISARSRKALSLIIPNIYGDPAADKEYVIAIPKAAKLTQGFRNAPSGPELGCEEAGNYPIYDPENPDHNTACRSPKTPRGSRSWSPLKPPLKEWIGKESLRSKSPSPNRMLTSSRKALNDFANTFKAKATPGRPSTPPGLLRDPSPMGRDSEKSVKSKKSVHWRSSETMVTSLQDIPKDFSPVLGTLEGLDEHFLGSALALTARPPPPMSILAAMDNLDKKPQRIELPPPVLAEVEQPPLPTPMPGTNLPLEDPFDDNAAIPEKDTKIFDDSASVSVRACAALELATDIEVLVDLAPGFVATETRPERLEHCIPSHASSLAYDADDDSTTSEDTDNDMYNLTSFHPRPPYMRRHDNRSKKSDSHELIVEEPKTIFPEIKVSSSSQDIPPKGHPGILRATTEVESPVSLGSPLEDSDKENQCPEEVPLPPESSTDSLFPHIENGHGCLTPSLTESAKLDVAPPKSPSRLPLRARLNNTTRLASFHLQSNVISSALQRDAAAFRFTDSSDEQPAMEIVENIELFEQAHEDTTDVKGKGRTVRRMLHNTLNE